MRTLPWYLLLVLIAAPSFAEPPDSMNHDLLEVTVPQLEQMYRDHKYTVTQVVQWHLARIAKYNGIYRAVQNVDTAAALAEDLRRFLVDEYHRRSLLPGRQVGLVLADRDGYEADDASMQQGLKHRPLACGVPAEAGDHDA